MPDQPGNVVDVKAGAGRIAFRHRDTANRTSAIYVEDSGVFTKVVGIDDQIEGSDFEEVELVAFDGTSLLLIIRWRVGSTALYRAFLE